MMCVLCFSSCNSLFADQDGAEPSPNSVSARNLLRLGILLDSENYRSKAKMTFMACEEMLDKYPMALTQMLIAYLDFLHPPPEVRMCSCVNFTICETYNFEEHFCLL